MLSITKATSGGTLKKCQGSTTNQHYKDTEIPGEVIVRYVSLSGRKGRMVAAGDSREILPFLVESPTKSDERGHVVAFLTPNGHAYA